MGEKYVEYCRSNLIKYRPWIGALLNAWGSENNENVPGVLRREIESLTEALKATKNTVGHNGGAKTNSLTDDTSDIVNNNNGDSDDVQIQWDRNHDWSQLEHEYNEEF
eukprot:15358003-Ditylum_brightwellii.AAC.1